MGTELIRKEDDEKLLREPPILHTQNNQSANMSGFFLQNTMNSAEGNSIDLIDL